MEILHDVILENEKKKKETDESNNKNFWVYFP